MVVSEIEPRPGKRADALLWLRLAAPLAAWLAFQQGTGTLVYLRCHGGGPPTGPLLGAAAIAICLVAGGLCWRDLGPSATPLRRFLDLTGVGIAALCAFACALMTASMMVIPACAR